MALTKVTGQVINNTTGLVVGVTTVGGGVSATDAFFSGIVTAVGNASFSGNLTVGGVLTYEDVTNVDSVGLITARNGVVVGSGITLSKDGDIFATGVTTATKFVGDGSELTGVASTENIRTNTNATFLQNINVSGSTTTGSLVSSGAVSGTTGTFSSEITGTRANVLASSTPQIRINNDTGDGSGTRVMLGKATTDNNFVNGAASGDTVLSVPGKFIHGVGTSAKVTVETAGNVNVASNLKVAGVCTATSFSGDGSNLTGVAAISVAQQFRLAADQTGSSSAGTVLTNWEESDTDYQRIGSTVWSQSSGVFSCSVTGIYLCQWTFVVNNTSTGDAYDPNIQISTDSGSSYSTRSRSWAHIANGYVNRASPQNQFLFDVSNTSTFRLRYRQSQDNACSNVTTIAGSSSENMTNILFIRLGDT